jgi:hypothetical protein
MHRRPGGEGQRPYLADGSGGRVRALLPTRPGARAPPRLRLSRRRLCTGHPLAPQAGGPGRGGGRARVRKRAPDPPPGRGGSSGRSHRRLAGHARPGATATPPGLRSSVSWCCPTTPFPLPTPPCRWATSSATSPTRSRSPGRFALRHGRSDRRGCWPSISATSNGAGLGRTNRRRCGGATTGCS